MTVRRDKQRRIVQYIGHLQTIGSVPLLVCHEQLRTVILEFSRNQVRQPLIRNVKATTLDNLIDYVSTHSFGEIRNSVSARGHRGSEKARWMIFELANPP